MSSIHPNITLRKRRALQSLENNQNLPLNHKKPSRHTPFKTQIKLNGKQFKKPCPKNIKNAKNTKNTKNTKNQKIKKNKKSINENKNTEENKTLISHPESESESNGGKTPRIRVKDTASTRKRKFLPLPKNSLPQVRCDIRSKYDDMLFVEGTPFIFNYLREKEKCFLKIDPLSLQSKINERRRKELVDWIAGLHERCSLRAETLFLTVYLLDSFLSVEKVDLNSLQLIGAGCYYVANKYEETVSSSSNDLVYFSKGAFTREMLLKTEGKVLKKINFRLTVPYSLTFARRFLRVARATRFARRYVEYLLELSILDIKMVGVLPSKIAASAVFITLRFSDPYIDENWEKVLEKHTGYKRKEIKPLVRRMMDLTYSHSNRNFSVYRKFSRRTYGEVAKIPLKVLMQHRNSIVSEAKD